MFGPKDLNLRDLRTTPRRTNGYIYIYIYIGEGILWLFIAFDTIVGVREPNYGVICLSLLQVDFQEKVCLN